MAWQRGLTWKASCLLLLSLQVSCLPRLSPPTMAPSLLKTMPSSIHVPTTIERLAILYPKTYNQDLRFAFARLEGAAFQLKEQRPDNPLQFFSNDAFIGFQLQFALDRALDQTTADLRHAFE